jgi:hypothetical protein
MKIQNRTQQFNETAELFLPLSEDELKLVHGGGIPFGKIIGGYLGMGAGAALGTITTIGTGPGVVPGAMLGAGTGYLTGKEVGGDIGHGLSAIHDYNKGPLKWL